MAYRMTVRRKAALRKAQLVSARKRRKNRLNSPHKNKAIKWRGKRLTNRQVRNVRIALGGAVAAYVYGGYKIAKINKNYGI